MAVVRSCVLATVVVWICCCAADDVAKPSGNTRAGGATPPIGATPSAAVAGTVSGSVPFGAAGAGAANRPVTPQTAPSNPPPSASAGMTPMNPNVPAGGAQTAPRAGAGAPASTPTTPAGMMPVTPAMPAPKGNMDPVVPAVPADCPEFKNSTITYKGLGGIQVVAGQKASAPTAPMVFYWHGTGSFSGEFAAMAAAVNQGVVQEGGVLVSFQGSTGGDLLSGTAIFGMGDFALADGLFACADKHYNIDPRRVYATGCSAGGLFSGAMAAARSTYMAAAAPNSGGWVVPVAFQNAHVPALMTVHGAPGLDVVVIDFSQSSQTADMGFKQKGGFVINCNHGGGHCGGAGLAGDIWKFFKAHPFGVNPNPWAMGLPAGFSQQCKIF